MGLDLPSVLALGAAGLMGISCLCLGIRLCRTGKAAVTPEQVTEARRNKRHLTELLEHPGWKLLSGWGEAQLVPRKHKILLEPTETIGIDNYLKGEVQGIELMLRMPSHLIDEATAIIALDVNGSDDPEDE